MDRIRFKTFASIDCSTPENVPLCAKYRKSIAYSITKDRMPITLTRIIDQLYRDKLIMAEKYGEGSSDELKSIIGSLSKLKSDIQTNKPLTPLNDISKCSEIWNRLLNTEKEKLNGKDPVWFECTFLFCDCYFFRRLIEVFEISKTFSSFDPYDKQKYEAFTNSLGSISSLSKYSNAVINEIPEKSIHDLKEELLLMLQISTWGNQCDLALNSEESGSKLEEAVKQVNDKQEYILANDSEKVWDLMQRTKETACREHHQVVVGKFFAFT
ncbi:hypothetical protein J437_LFUL004635 [Ladona fulva]|uniref:Sugar phosphate phosphatase n=1 Tax=Ladona fulva TaxID=123851 RepID=A0A8K0K024_LADFU|nr:hypothetical protein J437_LFUL004635 [Ladona fulva]